MPQKRKIILSNNEIYHILNRSVGKIECLVGNRQLVRAISLLDYYRFPQDIRFSKYSTLAKEVKADYIKTIKKRKPLIEIYAYALMPDHFHLLVKQIQDNGIKIFISNFQNAYAKYFNKKNDRDGSLFKSPFKTKWIEDDEVFIHVSRYIHLNPVTSFIISPQDLPTYPWTSYSHYAANKNGGLINTNSILKTFGSIKKYKKFVFNQVDYQRRLHLIKKLTLE